MWQYTNAGTVKGVNGRVDMNYAFNDYPTIIRPKHKPTAKPNTTPVKKKGKTLYLPKTDSKWRIYPLDKKPVKGNEKGYLNPKRFGGLKYEILGETQKDVYIIKTGDFGKVQIYAAPSTGAKIK